MPKRTVYTIGHSNRSIEELIEALLRHGIEVLVDIRRWPRSRRYPHFNREHLSGYLREAGIEYVWLGEALGGYRRVGRDVDEIRGASCFASEGFRAYATYITTSQEAISALKKLAELALNRVTAIMCSERLPWRCHRKLVSDWLFFRGFRVVHILGENTVEHRPTSCARLRGGRLVYE